MKLEVLIAEVVFNASRAYEPATIQHSIRPCTEGPKGTVEVTIYPSREASIQLSLFHIVLEDLGWKIQAHRATSEEVTLLLWYKTEPGIMLRCRYRPG